LDFDLEAAPRKGSHRILRLIGCSLVPRSHRLTQNINLINRNLPSQCI
jgi:hypothetical protein